MMKCPKCGEYVESKDNICPNCARELATIIKQGEVSNTPCRNCSKRGKWLNYHGKQECLCYYCYVKLRDGKDSFDGKKALKWGEKRRAYFYALQEFYLKPLFYGEIPEIEKIQRAWDGVIKNGEY